MCSVAQHRLVRVAQNDEQREQSEGAGKKADPVGASDEALHRRRTILL